MKPIKLRIAEELGVREQQVAAAISLLDGGATVPFVARYRKEATGTLDDAQLRTLEERLRYLRELEERRGGDPGRGTTARRAGGAPHAGPQPGAAGFVDADRGVPDPAAALAGARAILVERFGEDGDLIGTL